MANEIKADIAVRGADKAARDLKGVGAAADNAGDDLKDMGKDAKYLSSEVTRLEADLKSLVTQLDKTGDVTLKKDIRRTQRELRQTMKLTDIISPGAAAGGAGQAGAAVGQGLIEGASTWIKGPGGPILGGALAGAAVASSPFIGSTIAAAVLGGAGAGGIIGGIALAAQDPRVKAAAEEFAAAAMGDLSVNLGAPFVGPTIEALQLLGNTVEDVTGELGSAFASVSREVGPLVKGIDGLARNAVPGLTEALDAAEPIIRTVSKHLPQLGTAVSEASSDIADGADGATMALDLFLDGIQGTVVTLGQLIGILGETYEAGILVADGIGAAADATPDWAKNLFPLAYALGGLNNLVEGQVDALDAANEATPVFASNLENVARAEKAAAAEATALRDALSALVDTELGAERAAIAAERAIDELSESVKANGTSLDIGSEAGRRNTETILDGIDAVKEGAQREYDLAAAHGATAQEAEKAAKAYRDKYTAALEEAAIKAGFNRDRVRELLDELRKLDGKKITYTLIQKGGVTIGAKVQGGTILSGLEERAVGGPVKEGQPYKVGEEGEELFVPDQDGTIMTAPQTKALLSGQSAGTPALQAAPPVAAAPAVIQLVVKVDSFGDNDIMAAIMRKLHIEIMNQGGDVQDVLGCGWYGPTPIGRTHQLR